MEEIKFLILTILFELPVALFFLRREDWRRVVLVVVGVNMVSHPLIWQLVYFHHLNWFLAEANVAFFEGIILALIFKERRLLAAFTGLFMNFVTAALGYLFF
jgi:hypothetical protein